MNYFLAYPRTASTLFGFLLEVLYGRPMVTAKNVSSQSIHNKYKVKGEEHDHYYKNDSSPICMRLHYSTETKMKDDGKNPLILIVRNPIELIYTFEYTRTQSNKVDKLTHEQFVNTFNKQRVKSARNEFKVNLDVYLRWKGPKTVVYYEELINDKKTVMEKMINFLSEEEVKSPHTLDRLDYFSDLCLNGKKKDGLKMNTFGKDIQIFTQYNNKKEWQTVFAKYDFLDRYWV